MTNSLKDGAVPIGVLALVVIGFLAIRNMAQPPAQPADHRPTVEQKGEKRVVMLHSSNWKFEPSTIRVKQGENVSLHLMGIQGNHGIAIPGLGINKRMFQGTSEMVDIPTDKPGTYDFFCNVACGAGHADMQGTIIIE